MTNEKQDRRRSSDEASHNHAEHNRPSDEGLFDSGKPLSSAKAAHPLAGYSNEQLAHMGEKYAREHQHLTDEEEIRAFRLGAIIAGDMDVDDDPKSLRAKYASVPGLSEEERQALVGEVEHRWKHPSKLYFLVTSKSIYHVC